MKLQSIRKTIRSERFLACLSVSAAGATLAAVHLWYLLRMEVRLAARISGAVIPFVLALGIVYTGYWAYRHEYETEYVLRLCLWAWGGGACLAAVGLLIVFHNYTLTGQLSVGYFLTLAYMATVGVLVGTVIGNAAISTLRQQIIETERSKRELEATKRELERSNERLQKRTQQLDFFNSILRHDMMNGMNVIHARADMLTHRLDGEDREYAETILEWTEDIIDLGEKVRSILGTVTADDDSNLSRENLTEVVREEAERARSMADGATVETDLQEAVLVTANDLLPEVVGNVVTNAVEHSDVDAPRVEVSLTADGDEATLTVADNGCGIDDERKERIFSKGVTSDPQGGSGFGLYFVKTMVESYGGRITVRDNDPTGSVFVIELPRA